MTKTYIKSLLKDKTSVLFILLVLSTVVLPTTYSRYISTEMSRAVGTTAKWDVTYIPSDNTTLNLVALNATQANYLFSIKSLSEVACDYSIVISNVPNNISLIVDNNTSRIYTPDSDGSIKVNNIGSFELDSLNDTNNHILTFVTNASTTAMNTSLSLNVEVLQRIGSDS